MITLMFVGFLWGWFTANLSDKDSVNTLVLIVGIIGFAVLNYYGL